jgi:hypothetical protein
MDQSGAEYYPGQVELLVLNVTRSVRHLSFHSDQKAPLLTRKPVIVPAQP